MEVKELEQDENESGKFAIRLKRSTSTIENLKLLNESLRLQGCKLHVWLKPNDGSIQIRYKSDKGWQRQSVFRVLYEHGLLGTSKQERAHETLTSHLVLGPNKKDKSNADKERNYYTLSRLSTLLPELSKRVSGSGGVDKNTKLCEYVEQLSEHDSSPSRYVQLNIWLKKSKELEECPLSQFNIVSLRKFIDVLKCGAIVDQTRDNILQTLITALNKAKEDEKIAESPFSRLPKKEKQQFKHTKDERAEKIAYLEPEEVAVLRNCYEQEQYKQSKHALQIFLFQITTGFRVGDILNLKWENVDFKDNKFRFTEQKTKKNRVVAIIDKAKKYLPEYDKRTMKPTDRVFPYFDENTKRATACVNKLLKRYEAAIGNKHLHTHMARHTFAVLMLKVTGNLALVQSIMGHFSIEQTAVYAKILDRTKDEAQEKYNSSLDNVL